MRLRFDLFVDLIIPRLYIWGFARESKLEKKVSDKKFQKVVRVGKIPLLSDFVFKN